jgi:3-deoxy-manno-octulosonate cytidylyltransferase (CMP-KDO synthetase)
LKMKVIGIIPARYNSARLAGKPLLDLEGMSMIERTYRGSLQSQLLESLIVATDDRRIYDAVQSFGGDVELTLAGHKSGTDRITEVAARRGLADEDIVVNIQGDQPLIEAATIDCLVQPLLDNPALVMSTLSYPIIDPVELTNPNIVKLVTDRHGMALYFSRAPIPFLRDPGEKPPTYYKHLGLYAYRRSFLVKFAELGEGCLEHCEKLEQLRVLENGYGIKVVESATDSIEVDTPEDAARVRRILAERKGV